jgi:NAD dependent epimerase/dehydratase
MTTKRVLVTGADGFIGSHLVEHLVDLGHTVRAFVLYNSFGTWGWLEQASPAIKAAIEVIAGDVRDYHSVRAAMTGVDAVLHLAALIAIPYSYRSPLSYVETNITGTLHVLQAARDLGVAQVIQTSTSEVYGTAQFVPITEEHPLNAQSPYAATKIAADQLALSFHRSYDLPVTVLRPFNTYGPRQSARAVIPTIIAQLAAGETRIRLGSLTPTRDFTFVDDTVRGFTAALGNPKIAGETINLGTGEEISIRGVSDEIISLMGIAAISERDDDRVRPEASEVERLCAANDKARALLGWTPSRAGRDGFRSGLLDTIAWFTDPANLALYKSSAYNI